MQVPVEDAVDHRALEQRDDERPHHRGGVDARGAHALCVAEREALEALHHEHASRHERRVGSRDDHGRVVGLVEDARDVDHVPRLEAEVQLLDDRLGEHLDQCGEVQQLERVDPGREERRHPRHDPDVALHEALDARSLDLDGDGLAGAQHRVVDLCDRRRGDGRLVEGGEEALERRRRSRPRSTDLTWSNPSAGTRSRTRWNSRDELLGKQPLGRRDDLSELDVGGSER